MEDSKLHNMLMRNLEVLLGEEEGHNPAVQWQVLEIRN